jgi:hypothetical protein
MKKMMGKKGGRKGGLKMRGDKYSSGKKGTTKPN